MINYKLLISYEGTRYKGWQRLGNAEDDTVQGKIEGVLSKLFGCEIEIRGSGRTDAGAHARGQVANFYSEEHKEPQEILRYLRKYLPKDIGVLEATVVGERFHSRLSAKEKTYVYRIWNSEKPNVFDRRYMTQIPSHLNVAAMSTASQDFLGSHDFISFCSNKNFKKSSVRIIKDFSIETMGEEVRITIRGNGFLHNMVRIMVGTLLEVGQGKKEMDCIPEIIAKKQRLYAGETAPACGLCLMEVVY